MMRTSLVFPRNVRSLWLLLLGLAPALPLSAQPVPLWRPEFPVAPAMAAPPASAANSVPEFRSLTDSLDWARARQAALAATGRHVVVSLHDRRLWWMDGSDTTYTAPIAVGKGTRLEYGDAAWDFSTPRGVRRVIRKERNPVWTPPDWHYVELARDSAYTLVHLKPGRGVPLADGSRVVVRNDRIGRVLADGTWEEIPVGEEAIFGDTLFVPPLGTANRRIVGELGAYKLDLGEGYLIHGTPDQTSIGSAVTHGCIRVGDEDLEYLFRNIPPGTRVYIY